MSVYTKQIEVHQEALQKMNKKYTLFGFLRFLMVAIFAFSIYQLTKSVAPLYIVLLSISAIAFFILIRFHNRLADEIKMKETLIHINQQEIDFLENGETPFENGIELSPTQHAYAYDLDLFGNHSLFQHLNRTATFIGKSTLAKLLLGKLSNNEIEQNQEAIQELSQKINFRQDLYASSIILNDNRQLYTELIAWSRDKKPVSKKLTAISFIMPVIFLAAAVLALFSQVSGLSTIVVILFMSNLSILYSRYKVILKDVLKADRIHETILHYSKVLTQIETESFKSERLKNLQRQLQTPKLASIEIKELSSLFGSLISIQNAMASVIMNGTSLYHIHAYHALLKWKNQHGDHVANWLETLGTFEALNSLANFAFNNPSYCFPELNESHEISFQALGHPLINSNKRVCNSVSFKEQPFIILTGSNMSGKSTFLRSLGINMVLAGIGASVCAEKANIHPLNVYVSMRLSDSLSDDESYFFAEVKRLQQIMQAISKEQSFVLLDEILRGTNSDDKRNGTIEVIKKMMSYKAIGAIATHDLEICNTTSEYPTQLVNKCFEVEIVNNDLYFDYQLRDGVCKNKSATFLMKKMDVI